MNASQISADLFYEFFLFDILTSAPPGQPLITIPYPSNRFDAFDLSLLNRLETGDMPETVRVYVGSTPVTIIRPYHTGY